VQVPLPDHIDERVVIEAISPAKDVEASTPTTSGGSRCAIRSCAVHAYG